MNYGDYVYPACVREESPWKNWKELIEWARKNPGDVKIGLTAAKKASAQGFVFRQIEQKERSFLDKDLHCAARGDDVE
jgi:hypothetical protein